MKIEILTHVIVEKHSPILISWA